MKKITFFSLVTFLVLLFSTTMSYSRDIDVMQTPTLDSSPNVILYNSEDVQIQSVFVNVNDDCVAFPLETPDSIEISKVVTANNDGNNDVFEISDLEPYDFTADVQIFNRFGKIVYESSNYQNNWDGHNNGSMTTGSNNKLPTGTYYYLITIVGSGFEPITGYVYLTTQ